MPIPDICSHDAPDQKPGTACIRCGKMLPGEPPKTQEEPKVEDETLDVPSSLEEE